MNHGLRLSEDFVVDDESKGALNVLRWAYNEYDDELVYACSFGVEGIVMIDLISQIKPDCQSRLSGYRLSFSRNVYA